MTNLSFENNSAWVTRDDLVALDHGKLKRVGAVDQDRQVAITIGLEPRNEMWLDLLYSHLQSTGIANRLAFEYVTSQQVMLNIGRAEEEYAEIIQHFKNCKVVAICPQGVTHTTMLWIEGPAHAIGKAMRTRLARFIDPMSEHRQEEINVERVPQFPERISSLIRSVQGISSVAQHKSKLVRVPHAAIGMPPLTPAASATLYNAPTRLNKNFKGTLREGDGVTVVCPSGYNVNLTALQQCWKKNGARRTLDSVLVLRPNGASTQKEEETDLDIQWSTCGSPNAKFVLYLFKSANDADVNVCCQQMINDNKGDVGHYSWGEYLRLLSQGDVKTQQMMFKQLAVQGTTFNAAAGDAGYADCSDPRIAGPLQCRLHPRESCDVPSVFDSVTSVGGTANITANADGSLKDQQCWVSSGGAIADGEGIAGQITFPRPDWQYGQGMPDAKQVPYRLTSDIAMPGDYASGMEVLSGDADEHGIATGDIESGAYAGTSYASPNYGGSIVVPLVQAVRAKSGDPNKRLGPLGPILYEFGRSDQYKLAFYDVVKGSNGNGVGPGFPSGPFWDHGTGWGTPNIAEFVELLSDALVGKTQLTFNALGS